MISEAEYSQSHFLRVDLEYVFRVDLEYILRGDLEYILRGDLESFNNFSINKKYTSDR